MQVSYQMDAVQSQGGQYQDGTKSFQSLSASRLCLYIIAGALAGYALLNKGFAYIGYPPLYIGELVLGVCLLFVLAGAFSVRVFKSPITWLILAFGFWQALATLPYLEKAGLNAIRDSAIWYYAAFAILFGGILLRGRLAGVVPKLYGHWLPWFLLLALPFFLITEKYQDLVPRLPFTDTPIIWLKAGDMGAHLAGAAAFLTLGLHRYFPKRIAENVMSKEYFLWALFSLDIIAAGSRNRGGFVAVIIACAVITMLRPMNRLVRIAIPLLVVVVIAGVIDIRIPVGGERYVSVQQISDNLTSVVLPSSKRSGLSDTSDWRIQWWTQIVKETIHGDYFWTGRGYGENLAEAHGFADATGNRSPHNAHLTILSRSGVPGAVFWILLQAVILGSLLRAFFRARRDGADTLANLNLWTLAYLLAFLTNASFDVFLEGPQGGIWYWCVVGFAIALTEEQRALVPKPHSPSVEPNRSFA